MTSDVGNEGAGAAALPSRRRQASIDDLFKKKRRETEVVITSQDDDGGTIELTLRYRAIGSREYDDLVSKYPPTREQKADGAAYNVDLFAPALISAVSMEPRLSLDDAKEIYNSPEWSGGEIGGLFIEALKLCNAGLDVPFNGRG